VSNTSGTPTSFQNGNTEVQNDSGNKRPDNVGGPIQERWGPSDDSMKDLDDSMEDLDDIADNNDIPDDSNKQQVVKDIEDELDSEEEEEVSLLVHPHIEISNQTKVYLLLRHIIK